MATLFQQIEDEGMTFHDVCKHHGLDPEAVEDALGCQSPHAADAYGIESARIEHMTSEQADRSYDSL